MSSTEIRTADAETTAIGSPVGNSRKNGKLASCEPCRKRKTRCDHQQPICARCRRRGLAKQCFYHPAPLTKRTNGDASHSGDESHTRNNSASDYTRYATYARPEDNAPRAPVRTLMSTESDLYVSKESHESRVETVQNLVAYLHHLPTMLDLVQKLVATSASLLVPGSLVLPALRDLYDQWTRTRNIGELTRSLAEKIVASTEAAIDVRSMTSAADFCKMYHGDNLRLEMLGLIYTMAGRSCMFSLIHDGGDRGTDYMTIIQDLFHCSNTSLRLVREMAPEISDALLWLDGENLLFTTAVHGDAGHATWRRLCDMATDISLLDLHRESSYQGLPFFIAQSRRRIFAAAYHHDKLLATLSDRPPRILKRYSDCEMPLDLTEKEMFTDDPAELERLLQGLTADGWSNDRKFTSSAWARLRYNVAVFREEVLEYPFRATTPENMEKMKNLSRRSNEQYRALPTHLQYTSDCWELGLPNSICFMLTAAYLSHRQLDFQIFRLLEKDDDTESLVPLLLACDDIVTTVLHVGTLRTRQSFLAMDFTWLMMAYGLPSAAVLSTALERAALSRTLELPPSMSRSGLIRKLTVFVSMLESLQGLGGTRKTLSIESASAISRTLDKVLDAPSGALTSSEPAETPRTGFQPFYSSESSEMAAPPGTSGLNRFPSDIDALLQNKDGLDLFDLPGWASAGNWADLGNDWMNF